jgi:hypothetical protein
VKKKLTITLVLLAFMKPALAIADECEPSPWTVTLEMLEPLTGEERQFVHDILGIDLSLDIIINQAIAESALPVEVFGGE